MKYKARSIELLGNITQLTDNLIHQLRTANITAQESVTLLESMRELETQLTELFDLEHDSR